MSERGASAVGRVVVVGDVMTDIVVRPRGPIAVGTDTPSAIAVRAGGSGANQAAWLATLGMAVDFIACVGRDAFGAQHRAALERVGVVTHLAVDETRPTGMVVALVAPSGERNMLNERGANLGLAPGHLLEAIFAGADCLVLSGYTLVAGQTRPTGLAALQLARRHGLRVCVDPASSALLVDVGPQAFLEWVRGADVLLPNLDEARLLSGEREPEAAAQKLRAWCAAVVVKLGAEGALWVGPAGAITRRTGEAVQVVDTTGAGDAFCAGFIAAWLRGGPPEEALAAGIHCGAEAASRVGARPVGAEL